MEEQNNRPFEEESFDQIPSGATGPGRRPLKTYLIAVALLIIAIIIVTAVSDKQDDADNLVALSDGNDVVVTINDGNEEVRLNLSDYKEGDKLDTFDDLDEAGLIINSTQGKPTAGEGSEVLVSSVVPAAEDNMVYFATKSVDKELQETFVGIYYYNTVSNRWQRLYKTTYDITEGASPFLRVLARSGEQLVLLKDSGAVTRDPCVSYWLEGEQEGYELLLLDLNDPYAGFSSFTLPEQLRQQAQADVTACEAK